MMPIERGIDRDPQEQQREIVRLLGEIVKNTVGKSVIFDTTNFADA